MSTSVRIGGVAVTMQRPIQWALTAGVRPVFAEFEAEPSAYRKIMGMRGRPVDLDIDAGEDRTVRISGLFVLRNDPGDHQYVRQVVLADRRYWWPYQHLLRRYNVRRRSGVRRLAGSLEELDDFVDQESYVRSSLRTDSSAWTGLDVLEDVLVAITSNEPGGLPPFIIQERIADALRSYPVEDLVLDDRADQSMERVLRYLSELQITVLEDGHVYAYSKVAGDDMIDGIRPAIWDQGWSEVVDRSAERPKEMHVLYTREVEIRFDYEEVEVTDTVSRGRDERFMENVLPVPEPFIIVNGEERAQGTWVTFNEAFQAWPNAPGLTRKLTHADVRRAMSPYLGLWQVAGQLGNAAPDGEWGARIQAIQNHWRQTFRVSRKWIDAMLNLKAERLSTIDVGSGQRAPSPAYCDYCYVPGQRAGSREDTRQWYAANVKAYPPGGRIQDGTIVAPARVQILDADQGIINVQFEIDPLKLMEMVLPGWIGINGQPLGQGGIPLPGRSGGFGDAANTWPIIWDAVNFRNPTFFPTLLPNWKIALIVTATPAFPNNRFQLHREVVKPSEVSAFVPEAMKQGLRDARGPVMEIRVPASLETARVAWIDDKGGAIERLFGVIRDDADIEGIIDDLTVNGGSAQGKDWLGRGASLKEISRAVAGRAYAMLADRHMGGRATALLSGVHPEGWISEVVHQVHPDGMATTGITLPLELPGVDIFSRMDAGTRATLLKLITGKEAR